MNILINMGLSLRFCFSSSQISIFFFSAGSFLVNNGQGRGKYLLRKSIIVYTHIPTHKQNSFTVKQMITGIVIEIRFFTYTHESGQRLTDFGQLHMVHPKISISYGFILYEYIRDRNQ